MRNLLCILITLFAIQLYAQDSTKIEMADSISVESSVTTNATNLDESPEKIKETQSENDVIIPSQGFSLTSLWRGVLGMISLLFIAFLFSSNRKAIKWKTVAIGVALQLIIAVGVLRVPFVQKVFDFIGQIFVSILDYTRAGSKFLFEGLVVDMDTFGFIFAFQVLPTIIFFFSIDFCVILFRNYTKSC